MRGPRAFTLVEMATAIAVSLIVLYASVMSIMALHKSLARSRMTAEVDGDAKVVTEHLVTALQGIGGYGIPIEGALFYEPQGCPARSGLSACGTHDRLTVLHKDPARPVVKLTGATPGGAIAEKACGAGAAFPYSGQCCLGVPPGSGDSFSLAYRQVYVLGDNGARKLAFVSSTSMGVASDPSTPCSVTFASSTVPAPFNVGDITAATRWSLVPVRMTTWLVDDNQHLLKAFHDWNLNGMADDDDFDVLSANIHDLHFALGYDVDGDGAALETGTPDDEWLGNALGDALGAGGLASASEDQLRMVGVGVIAGVRSPYMSDTPAPYPRVLDGDPLSGERTTFRKSLGYALFRNLNVFY